MLGPRNSRILAFVAVTAVLAIALDARAQTSGERADARAIATEAAAAFESAEFDRARELFERAEQLVHSPVHLLYLARSLEALGRLVEARETYLTISRETLERAAPRAFRDAQRDAVVELSAVEERVPTLTIDVARAGDGPTVIVMNGKRLPPEVAGVRRPVDPGEYRLRALAPGRKSRPVRVTLKENQHEDVRLVLRKLREGEEDAYAATAGSDDEGEGDDDEEARTRRPRGRVQGSEDTVGAPVGAYLALAAGGVGLLAGTFFYLKAAGLEDDATALCNGPGGVCPDDKRPEIDALDADARTNKTLAVGSFVVGGAGIVLGAALLLLHDEPDDDEPRPRKSAPHDEATLHAIPVVGLGTVGVVGSF